MQIRYPALVKKADYGAKISDIESKHINTANYNKFIKDIVAEMIKKKHFLKNTDIANLVNNTDLNKKIATLAAKAELKTE